MKSFKTKRTEKVAKFTFKIQSEALTFTTEKYRSKYLPSRSSVKIRCVNLSQFVYRLYLTIMHIYKRHMLWNVATT